MSDTMFDDLAGVFIGFIKGDELEAGLTAKITEKPKLVMANDPKYGFAEGPHQGKTIQYTFECGLEVKTYSTTSVRFKNALEASGAVVGDTVTILRTGKNFDTNFAITKA